MAKIALFAARQSASVATVVRVKGAIFEEQAGGKLQILEQPIHITAVHWS